MDEITSQLADKLAWQLTSWKAIELRVDEQPTVMPGVLAGDPSVFTGQEYHYIETALGQRYYEKKGFLPNGKVSRTESFSDGRRFTNVEYDPKEPKNQQIITLTNNFGSESLEELNLSDRPVPLFYFYVGRAPLHEALRDATRDATTSMQVIGRECHVFHFPRVRFNKEPRELRIYLDKASAIPLRFVCGDSIEKPLWTWEAESLDKVGDYWVPKNSRYRSYSYGDAAAPGSIKFEKVYKVTDVQYNKQYNMQTFNVAFQPGAEIVASKQAVKLLQGKNALAYANRMARNSPALAKKDVREVSKGSAVPIQAVESNGIGTFQAASMVLGVAVIMVALLVWWRRG